MARGFRTKRKAVLILSAALAIVALSATFVAANHDFPDVPNSAFYHNDVSWLVDAGITSGCGGGKFCPNDAVTRGQMAKFLHKAAPILSILEAGGENTDASITFTYEKLDTLGDFAKANAGSVLKITWTDHVSTVGTDGTDFCDYQVRVDDDLPDGDARAVNYGNEQTVEVTSIFSGFGPGTHTLSLWVRGGPGTTSCSVNHGNFSQVALIEEVNYQ